jgi:hypothetical protein
LTDLDSYVTTKLQQWLRARVDPIGPEINMLLEQLHEFGWQVRREGFDSILKKKINITEATTTAGLFESIANLVCRGTSATQREIAMKSVQETLFLCSEVDPYLSLSQVGKRLETYLELRGSKGLIRVFLSAHLCNLILINLHDSLQVPALEIFQRRMKGIERLCQTAAGLSVRSWAKWPDLTPTTVSSAIQTANDEMRKAVNRTAHIARPKS